MDEKIEKAFDVANYMATLSNQRRLILEEFNQKTIFYINRATFKLNPELINFTKLVLDQGHDSDVAFIDANNFPVIIEDVQKFYNEIVNSYFEAVNSYAAKFAEIRNKRNVKDIVSL